MIAPRLDGADPGSISSVTGKIRDCAEVAGRLSPNPGGVGPMAHAVLVPNVIKLPSGRNEPEPKETSHDKNE